MRKERQHIVGRPEQAFSEPGREDPSQWPLDELRQIAEGAKPTLLPEQSEELERLLQTSAEVAAYSGDERGD